MRTRTVGRRVNLLGVWLHSHEEDAGSAMVFRPRGHPFPRSRGREAIEFRPDGTFTWHNFGADDRGQGVPGRWEERENDRIEITMGAESSAKPDQRSLKWADDVLIVER